jgi:hypothetical protein
MQIAEDEEYVCRLTLQGHIDFHFAACIWNVYIFTYGQEEISI